MKKCLALLFGFFFGGSLVLAQTTQPPNPQPPATDIYLFELSIKKNKVVISNPINITQHKGYDNQPFFHPSKTQIFYSSINEEGRTDLLCHDFKKKSTVSITQTQEKEYSPTVTLDETFLSCIIQRDNGAQDLGKYPLDGGDPTIIIDNLKVGYHVWADNSHLGLYVLGTPNQLHYVRLPTKKDTIIAENIGRSLSKVPNESAISFIAKTSDKEGLIKKLNTQTLMITDIVPTITGSEDLCWLPDGKILMSDGTKLYFADPKARSTWIEVEVASGGEILKGVTRLSASADGKKLALVVLE